MFSITDAITSRWDNVILLAADQWLDCLHYQETRDHYATWLNNNPNAVTYVVKIGNIYSMGAQYGLNDAEYLSPYGNPKRIAQHF